MRTRHRRIVTGSASSGALTGNYIRKDCSSPAEAPAPYTMGAFNVDTNYIDECIRDGTGTAAWHEAIHRKKVVSIDTDTRPLVAPKVDGSGGTVTYNGIDPVWIPSNKYWLDDVSQWDVFSSEGLPQRWSIQSGFLPDEEGLRNEIRKNAEQLKADVLLNIVEANQLFPAVKSLASCIPEMAYHWRKLRLQIKTASASYLAWKFGVSPIISDCSKILAGTERLKKDLQRHIESQKTRTSREISVPMKFDNAPLNEGTFGSIIWGVRRYVGQIYKEPRVIYVLVTEPTVAYKTELFKKLDFALSRFATSPAQLAWELVPFSFVADWFVDISGALRVLDSTLRQPAYRQIGFTRSFSYIVGSSMTHEYRETCAGGSQGITKVGEVICSHYERRFVSDDSLIKWNPRFGKNQAGITAALVLQQLTKLSWGRTARLPS